MIYNRFISGLGFWMQCHRNSKTIWIRNWGHLIAEMIYDNRLEIWYKLSAGEVPRAESLATNSTPKLRKMMRYRL